MLCKQRKEYHASWIYLILLLSYCCYGLADIYPKLIRSHLGNSAVFTCNLQNDSNYVFWKFESYQDDDKKEMVRCSLDSRECKITDEFSSWEEIKISFQPFRLNITSVKKRNSGGYSCHSIVGFNSNFWTAQLEVLVPPSRPTISTDPSGAFVEASKVRFTCSVSGAHPPPDISWTWTRQDNHSNNVTTPSAHRTHTGGIFGTTQSTIVLMMTFVDDRSRIKCEAKNDLSFNVSETLILNVNYKPRFTDFLYNPLKVIEEDELILSCPAVGNPTPEIQWWDPSGRLLTNASTYRHNKANRQMSGVYICHAKNNLGLSKTNISVDILYGPVDEVFAPVTKDEGQDAELSCHSMDSNPRLYSIVWYGPNDSSESNPLSTHLTYPLRNIKRQFAGRYTCKVKVELTPSQGQPIVKMAQGSIQLIVRYIPEKPITLVHPSNPIFTGNPVSLQCRPNASEPGNPLPLFYWARKNNKGLVLTQSSWLNITSASLNHNGFYVCAAYNDMGQSEFGEIELIVNEFPKFLSELDKTRSSIPIGTRKEPIYCKVQGKPPPKVKWFLNDHPINSSRYTVIETVETVAPERITFQVTSSLKWTGPGRYEDIVDPDDNGIYSCQVESMHGNMRSWTELECKYKPIDSTLAYQVAVDLSKRYSYVELVCRVRSVPQPTFVWSTPRDKLVTRSTRDVRYNVTDSSEKYEFYRSSLKIFDVTQADFGSYMCNSQNSLGSIRVEMRLRSVSTPDPPHSLTVQSSTWESIYFSWVPGFNGGFQQNFTVLVVRESVSNQTIFSNGSANSFNITNLLPSTQYTIFVFGSNYLGHGNISSPLKASTKVLSIPQPSGIKFDSELGILSFTATDNLSVLNKFCLRIEMSSDSGLSWSTYRVCVQLDRDSVRVPSNDNYRYRARICLKTRPEVCSEEVYALPDLPITTIIIVACVCGLIIALLLFFLIYFVVRRHKINRREKAARENGVTPRMPPPSMSTLPYPPERASSNGSLPSHCQNLYNSSPGAARKFIRDSYSGIQPSSSNGKPYALVPPSPYDGPGSEAHERVSMNPLQFNREGSTFADMNKNNRKERIDCNRIFATEESSQDPLTSPATIEIADYQNSSDNGYHSQSTNGSVNSNGSHPPTYQHQTSTSSANLTSTHSNVSSTKIIYEVVV